ncbi:cell division protein FtsK [Bacillus tianshenii]|uniref:FtsK/SpoIIIE domain-containing protein n=1 Tax=Sutcliffiella tianshenii TaxID=1463404 RepID=UPI001CD2BECC|nr:FtsK/SpoIIIE domain-containing protein [Bacillus tianshenii]MCA1319777.1 cell division protein FtsK [Bacillus tianshenii]
MLFEITTSIIAGGLAGYAQYKKSGGGGNDHAKIVKIAANCGLSNREGKEIRIHRKSRKKGFTEYVYQMPTGLSAGEFQAKLPNFQDGLNIKRSVIDISFADFKAINWRGDIIKQLRQIVGNKKKLRKEVEIEFDGMLIFRVYDEALTDKFPYEESMFRRLSGWEVPAGVNRSGDLIKHDFEKIAHLVIGGATDFGKSNFLKAVITTLIHRKPNDARFVLIDLKGGTAFNRFRDAKQVESVAKSADEALAALTAAQERMNRMYEHLIEQGYEDVKEAGITTREFIIIDEAADIADNDKCQDLLKDIARRGRAAGLRLIYATQYPTTETLSSQVKRNCIGRLCFVIDTATASRVVLDQEGAEKLPLIQGRAIYKQNVVTHVVQTPHIRNEFIKETIQPHITIRARKEPTEANEKSNRTGAKGGNYSFVIEETELS